MVLSASCARDSALDESAAHFKGLDADVVREVLNDDEALDRIGPVEEGDARASLAQGIVINFIVCRDVARVYERWRETGRLPALAPLPTPDHPTLAYRQWRATYRQLQRWQEEGNRWSLRQWTTRSTGCGEWIPARPGDTGGPTIAGAIESNDENEVANAKGPWADGRIPVYIETVDASRSTVTVDRIALDLGTGATSRYNEDSAGGTRHVKYDAYVKDDIYITNLSVREVELPVMEDVDILVIGPSRTDADPSDELTLSELNGYLEDRTQVTPFWIEARAGRVYRITEQFVPSGARSQS